jgi:F-box-like
MSAHLARNRRFRNLQEFILQRDDVLDFLQRSGELRERGWGQTHAIVPLQIFDVFLPQLGLIQQLLPDEMVFLIFSHLDSYSLGAVQCVCKSWAHIAAAPALWQAACMEAFKSSGLEANAQLVHSHYRCAMHHDRHTAQPRRSQ